MSARLSFNQLYQRYGSVVYARCQFLLRDPEWAQDATHDVFIRLLRNGWPEDTTSLGRWMHRVTTNHCYNLLRGARRMAANEVDSSSDESNPGFETSILAKNLTERLMAQTPADVRATVELFHVRGLEQWQIAQALGVSLRTVLYRLARFQELAEQLAEV